MSKNEPNQHPSEEHMSLMETETARPEAAPVVETAQGSAEGGADLQGRLAAAEARAQENWDQLLRARAEQENLRRRTERELENAHKYALERFAQELLPVRDSLEMGLAAAGVLGLYALLLLGEAAQSEKLREGTELTLKMLVNAMDKFGIKEINPLNEPFNPDLHQAMAMQESAKAAPNTVITVMQKGYLLNDRLIRPAMVMVAKAANEKGGSVDEKA